MRWLNPPSSLDAAYEREAMIDGLVKHPAFPENRPIMANSKEWGEPPPRKNNKPSIHDLVIKDMESRKQMGLKKYGTVLQAGNGRNALKDAYEEVLDLAMYLKQKLEEENAKEN
mgnify:CR=1 FL=1